MEAISGEICFEAFEFAVIYSLKTDDRLPKIPRLIELGRKWTRQKTQGDLSTAAIPEFTEQQHANASEKLGAILNNFENWGQF